MNFDIELYHEGINLDEITPILPGEKLLVTVEAEEVLKGIKIQIYDPKGNMRIMSRRKGNVAKFETKFLNTQQEGIWSVKITGYSVDGTIDEDTEKLHIVLEEPAGEDPTEKTGETPGSEEKEEIEQDIPAGEETEHSVEDEQGSEIKDTEDAEERKVSYEEISYSQMSKTQSDQENVKQTEDDDETEIISPLTEYEEDDDEEDMM